MKNVSYRLILKVRKIYLRYLRWKELKNRRMAPKRFCFCKDILLFDKRLLLMKKWKLQILAQSNLYSFFFNFRKIIDTELYNRNLETKLTCNAKPSNPCINGVVKDKNLDNLWIRYRDLPAAFNFFVRLW